MALIALLIEVEIPAFDVRRWIVCGVTFTPQLLSTPPSHIVRVLTSQEEGLVPKYNESRPVFSVSWCDINLFDIESHLTHSVFC